MSGRPTPWPNSVRAALRSWSTWNSSASWGPFWLDAALIMTPSSQPWRGFGRNCTRVRNTETQLESCSGLAAKTHTPAHESEWGMNPIVVVIIIVLEAAVVLGIGGYLG